MRVFKLVLGLVAAMAALVLYGAAPAAAQSDGGPEFKSDDIIKSTVRVVAYDAADRRIGWTTGWIISGADFKGRAGNAIVATTFNSLARADHVRVIPGGGGPELPARIRSTKRETKIDFDVAFLEVKGLTSPAFQIAEAAPDSARPVYSSGFSFVADTNEASRWSSKSSIQSGTVSKIFEGGMTRQSQAPVDQIEHNTPLDPGFSGGPLMDRCGRVVGLNTKDGGIRIGEDVPVALSRGSRFALAFNELVSVASQEGVPFETAGGPCGSQVATMAPAAAAAAAAAAPILTPPEPTKMGFFQSTGAFFRANPMMLGAVVILGLGALGLGLWLLFGKPAAAAPAPMAAPAPQPAPQPAPAPAEHKTTVSAPTIELNGRGPDGKALNFRFSADELANGAILGSDPSRAQGFVDGRSDYKVSRVHARLGFDGRNFTLEDVKSTNGTKVGGVRLEPNQPRVLMPGDEVELADVKLRVVVR